MCAGGERQETRSVIERNVRKIEKLEEELRSAGEAMAVQEEVVMGLRQDLARDEEIFARCAVVCCSVLQRVAVFGSVL